MFVGEMVMKSVQNFTLHGKKQYAGLFLPVPTWSGYLVRSDVIQTRLLGICKNLTVYSDNEPGQTFIQPVEECNELDKIIAAAASAAAGIFIQGDETVHRSGAILDEIADRLNLSWILDVPLGRRRVALIDGESNFEFRKNIFATATHLGIDLVVFDNSNHLGETYDEEESGPLAETVLLDMTLDDRLPQGIIDAMKEYHAPFDGITTFTDSFLCNSASCSHALSSN